MIYGNYYVSSCIDKGIERINPKGEECVCEGYFCEVYDDEFYENRIDYFCLAVGFEIKDMSQAELDKGIKEYLGV